MALKTLVLLSRHFNNFSSNTTLLYVIVLIWPIKYAQSNTNTVYSRNTVWFFIAYIYCVRSYGPILILHCFHFYIFEALNV